MAEGHLGAATAGAVTPGVGGGAGPGVAGGAGGSGSPSPAADCACLNRSASSSVTPGGSRLLSVDGEGGCSLVVDKKCN